MANFLKLSIIFYLTTFGDCLNPELLVEFFVAKNVKMVTSFLCDSQEQMQLSKLLSSHYMMNNVPQFDEINTAQKLGVAVLYGLPIESGILVDMKCPNSQQIIKIASENRFLDISTHWLLHAPEHFTKEEFEETSLKLEPDMFNIAEYLEFRTSEMPFEQIVRNFNKELNEEVFSQADVVELLKKQNESATIPADEISSPLAKYINLKAIIDSEVYLFVPFDDDTGFNIYDIHRKSLFTRMLIQHIATVNDSLSLAEYQIKDDSAVVYRKDFNNTLLRAGSALIRYDYLSRTSEVTSKPIDYWTTMSMQLSVLPEQQYNFRMVIKVFDDYGYLVNGSYTGLVKFMEEQRLDVVATGMLHLISRMGAVTYISSYWRNRNCLIFKQPNLSQVTNIFFLPFSLNVWLASIAVILFASVIIYLQFHVGKWLHEKLEGLSIAELYTFMTGAIFQQGTEKTTEIISARLTMLVFLVSSLFLFTAYTANIVVLLQSPSTSIRTVEDFMHSALEMGCENFTYQQRMLEEEKDPMIRKLYDIKLKKKSKQGKVFIPSEVGMKKVQEELFAFHLEQPTAARIIQDTFTEADQCRLKTITLFPSRFHGHSAPKKSAYFEFFAQAFRWYNEAGFVYRTEKRFTHQLPKCTKDVVGFSSIDLNDVRDLIKMWTFGVLMSLGLFFLELSRYRASRRIRAKKMWAKSTKKLVFVKGIIR